MHISDICRWVMQPKHNAKLRTSPSFDSQDIELCLHKWTKENSGLHRRNLQFGRDGNAMHTRTRVHEKQTLVFSVPKDWRIAAHITEFYSAGSLDLLLNKTNGKLSLNLSLSASNHQQHVSAIKPSSGWAHFHNRKYILQCHGCYGRDLVLKQDGVLF